MCIKKCRIDIWCVKLQRLISPLCVLRLLGQRDYAGSARAADRTMRLLAPSETHPYFSLTKLDFYIDY